MQLDRWVLVSGVLVLVVFGASGTQTQAGNPGSSVRWSRYQAVSVRHTDVYGDDPQADAKSYTKV